MLQDRHGRALSNVRIAEDVLALANLTTGLPKKEDGWER
jgi:hypothetical protein